MFKELPIRVTISPTTVLNIHATMETMEAYGGINQMVHEAVKPLEHVQRIEVTVYDNYLEEDIQQVTYDKGIEQWIASGERVVVTLDPYGIGMEDIERGYLDRIDGILPKYAIRYQKHAKKKHVLLFEDITDIESASEVNRRTRNERRMQYYHAHAKDENQRTVNQRRKKREKNRRDRERYHEKKRAMQLA